jgi:RNA polymerase sigma factor
VQIRSEIQKAKLELWFQLLRKPTGEEIIEKVGISIERYHEVMRASKPVLSLHSRHKTTQEELISGVADVNGGDDRRQSALLRLALDDVVSTHFFLFLEFVLHCFLSLIVYPCLNLMRIKILS